MAFSTEKKEMMINSLVERLPLIRQEMNVSQTELGEKVGLSRQSISSIERGISKLSWNNYLAIMMFLVANREKCTSLLNENNSDLDNDLNEVIKILDS